MSRVILQDNTYTRFWIIAYPNSHSRDSTHYPAIYWSASLRRECIAAYLTSQKETWNADRKEATMTWRQWYARGYRCVRVKAVPA